ncbi:toll-Interleukin receptor [Chromobacterium sp. LK11]|uniref:toll/interleukin-1 receptor domain-containing protein n=1 Tax=Chromobacterium sp. LK11 TaxID=1628212 RepID=UPI000652ABDA|nr:toll/interleukin-1 receptor domain-containing protein [Chromobacterium sp. LK11]KMN78965.1 toll-Interleukin receptor [Chromobacterium sp. LK11]
MAFFTKSEARAAATSARGYRTAKAVLTATMESYKEHEKFDIFLSHSSVDSDLVLGVMILLQKQNLNVYVDWVVDRQLNRNSVDKATAATLRQRMKHSHSMIYIATDSASNSKWMPWELGFFDGHKPGQVAILPLQDTENQSFQGQEYLGLYPVVTKHLQNNTMNHYIEDRGNKWSTLSNFARGVPSWKGY